MNISTEFNYWLILFYKIRGLKSEKIPKNFKLLNLIRFFNSNYKNPCGFKKSS